MPHPSVKYRMKRRSSVNSSLQKQLTLRFLQSGSEDCELNTNNSNVQIASDGSDNLGSLQINIQQQKGSNNERNGRTEKKERVKRIFEIIKQKKKQTQTQTQSHTEKDRIKLTQQQIKQIAGYFNTFNNKKDINESILLQISRHYKISIVAACKLKKYWHNDNSLSNFIEGDRVYNSQELMRVLGHHIQATLKYNEQIKLEQLVQRVRQLMPEKLRPRITSIQVTQALQALRNPLNSYAISAKTKVHVCQKTGIVKNVLDVGEYCKNLLNLLDSSKIVFFVAIEELAETVELYSQQKDHQINPYTQPNVPNILLFRGILGSNLQSYCDILSSSQDSSTQNTSFNFLLKVLALKTLNTQKYLYMSKSFMQQYSQSLSYASQAGFFIVQLASSFKEFSPLFYWIRDLKLLSRKYSVRTSQELTQILQYESTRFDRQIYAEYFRSACRKMRRVVFNEEKETNRRNLFRSMRHSIDDLSEQEV